MFENNCAKAWGPSHRQCVQSFVQQSFLIIIVTAELSHDVSNTDHECLFLAVCRWDQKINKNCMLDLCTFYIRYSVAHHRLQQTVS